MTDPIHIRRATPADAETVAGFNTAMAWETEQIRLDPTVIGHGVRAAIADPAKCDYWLAEIAGQVVGCLMVTFEWSDWRNGNIWWIQSVYVDVDFRRRGVFTAMYDHVITRAREAGVVAIRLYVEHENAAAQATYLRHGMHVTHYQVMERDLRS